MGYSTEQIDEMGLLLQFDLHSAQQGIKVHSSASPANIAAAKRLFEKGLIDQVDGGYLTALGRECAEHAQALKQILTVPK